MRELSLFSGAGGGLLGTHHLLGWECIGYVEWNDYCQRVLAARIADGYLPVAPIFGDIREFVQSGAAREYRGFADVVSAGFPCQPHSVAGKRGGADDPRDMWPATQAVICDVRPNHVLLENVAGLVSSGYLGIVLAGLASLGFMGRWGCISAGSVGADHERERLWIVAHAHQVMGSPRTRAVEQHGQPAAITRNNGPNPFDSGGRWVEMAREFRRMDDGVAHSVERTEALGNGQVPRVVARAWQLLA